MYARRSTFCPFTPKDRFYLCIQFPGNDGRMAILDHKRLLQGLKRPVVGIDVLAEDHIPYVFFAD
ncbi:MAG: hypothetical protein WC364_13705 [Eubacteriales bacterium]